MQVKTFEPETSCLRWVFVPADTYPSEIKVGLAGWRGQIKRFNKSGKKYTFLIKMGTFRPSWFSKEFVEELTFLSD